MTYLFVLLTLLSGSVMAQESLRVLTYNVYAKPDIFQVRKTTERMELVCERLKSGNWDVVFIQEVWTQKYRRMLSDCGFDYVMDLRKTGSTKKEKSLGSGLMILSKYPLEDQKRFLLTRPAGIAARIFHGEGFVRKSAYLANLVLPSGKKISLVNTHLVANYCTTGDWSNCQSYQNVRATQLAQVSDVVLNETQSGSVIFGGDLNMGPLPASRDVAWTEFDMYFPGYVQAPYTDADCTSCSDNRFKDHDNGKIDHLFVSPDLRATSGAVVLKELSVSRADGREMNLSDHYGWETVVEIP